MFGVSSVDEGLYLRNVKIKAPILVVGAIPTWAVETAVKNDIAFSIFNDEHLKACKDVYERTGIKPKVHVKIDTGMNRIGVRAEEGVEYIEKVRNADYLKFGRTAPSPIRRFCRSPALTAPAVTPPTM